MSDRAEFATAAAAELLTTMSQRLANRVADELLEGAAEKPALQEYLAAHRDQLRFVCVQASLATQRRLGEAVPTDESAQALFVLITLAAVRK